MQQPLTHSTQTQGATEAAASSASQGVGPILSTPTSILLVLLLSAFAIAPLSYPGYWQNHSGFIPIWNLIDLRANLGDVSWIPHIATSFDPLRSDGLLPYYLAALLPVEPVVAIKLVIAFGWLLGGVGTFLWLRSWLGAAGALVASLVYTYLPYQIVTVYVRGGWGETLFWGLLPWAILAATYLVTTPKVILIPIAAFFWLLLGLSQLGLAIFAVLFITAMLLSIHRPQALLPLLSAGLGIAGAAALYLLLSSHSLFQPAPTLLTDHFLYPFQLFSAAWGFGASRPGWDDGLSLQIGLAVIGLTILFVVIWLREQKTTATKTDRRLLFFLSAALLLSLLQFSLTAFIWSFLAALVTYPWQPLGFIGLAMAVMAGAALWLDARLRQLPSLAAIIIIVVLSVYPYLLPVFIQPEKPWLDGPQAQWDGNQLILLDHRFSVATTGHTAGLNLGETTIPLQQQGRLRPNDRLVVEVMWQPLQIFDTDLKVFVHLVDTNNNVLAQFDGYPQAGSYPTSQWIPGELISDAYPILLPDTLPPGPYRTFLGLYNENTLTRLPIPTDPDGKVILNIQE